MKFFGFGKKKKVKGGGQQPQPIEQASLVGMEQPKVKDPALKDRVLRLNSQGLEYYKTKKYDLAKDTFEKAIKIDPEFAEPYHHLSAIHGKNGNLELFTKYTMLFMKYSRPDNPMRNQFEALGLVDMLDLPPNPSVLCLKAIRLSESGDHRGALKLFQQAVDINPNYGAGWADIGACLIHLDQPAEAETALVKATELMPDDLKTWQALAVSYLDQKKLDGAEKAITACERLGASKTTISKFAIDLNSELLKEMFSKFDCRDFDSAETRAISIEKIARQWIDHAEMKPNHLCLGIYFQALALLEKREAVEATRKLEQAYEIASENGIEELKSQIGRLLHDS